MFRPGFIQIVEEVAAIRQMKARASYEEEGGCLRL